MKTAIMNSSVERLQSAYKELLLLFSGKVKPIANIEKAFNYQNKDLVERYAKRHKVSIKEAQTLFEECKKMLIVMAISTEPISPSKKQDEMWHHFILHTRDYKSYCESYLGHFLHHNPTETPFMQSRSAMLDIARKLFGDIDMSIWPSKEVVECDGSCSGDDYCTA